MTGFVATGGVASPQVYFLWLHLWDIPHLFLQTKQTAVTLASHGCTRWISQKHALWMMTPLSRSLSVPCHPPPNPPPVASDFVIRLHAQYIPYCCHHHTDSCRISSGDRSKCPPSVIAGRRRVMVAEGECQLPRELCLSL